ncbi:MAG: tRNA dihydrouridine synthase DusB, partial [Acetobacteraceae bacterium]|nr:tRNA dihydrouridine synthase DusB [Acetobacteraceae bacterium]
GLPGSAEFRATVMRLDDTATVIRLIHDYFDFLIARGITRTPPNRAEALAQAA